MKFNQALSKRQSNIASPAKIEPLTFTEAFLNAQSQCDDKEKWAFTDQQLFSNITQLGFNGSEVPAHFFRWLVYHLAENPSLQESIYQEIKSSSEKSAELPPYKSRHNLPLTEAVISETLRLHGWLSGGIVRRKTVAQSRLLNYEIPAGTIVVPLLEALMIDSKQFPQPFTFQPNNFIHKVQKQFLPFGLGKNLCSNVFLFFFIFSLVLALLNRPFC